MRLTTKYLESENYFADEISEDATEEERNKYWYSIIAKLGQLEDIEDELGIDLVTLIKALNNGIYLCGKDEFDTPLEIEHWKPRTFEIKYHKFIGWCFSKVYGGQTYNKNEDNFGFALNYSVVKFKDYGKTWALTKEELEK